MAHDSARERDARLFEHRRAAYHAVIDGALHWQRVANDAWESSQGDPSDEGFEDFSELIAQVDLFGSKGAGDQAWRLLDVVRQMTHISERSQHDSDGDLNLKFLDEYNEFVNIARVNMGLDKRFSDPPDMVVGGERIRI